MLVDVISRLSLQLWLGNMFSIDCCRRANSNFLAIVAPKTCLSTCEVDFLAAVSQEKNDVREICIDALRRHSLQLLLEKQVVWRCMSTCEVEFPSNCRPQNMFSSDRCRRARSTFLATVAQKKEVRAIAVNV